MKYTVEYANVMFIMEEGGIDWSKLVNAEYDTIDKAAARIAREVKDNCKEGNRSYYVYRIVQAKA